MSARLDVCVVGWDYTDFPLTLGEKGGALGNRQRRDAMSPLLGERDRVRGKVAMEKSGALGLEGAAFPLTPALSLGEREDGSPSWVRRGSLGLSASVIDLPSPRGEGQGEGKGGGRFLNRLKTSVPTFPDSALPFFSRVRRIGTTVIRHWLRRSFLQRPPNRVPDRLLVPAEMTAPETQNFHLVMFKPLISVRVFHAMFRRAVLKAVQFDVQPRFKAEKVQNEWAVGVLSAEFVRGEPAVAQPVPHHFFSPGIVFAEEPRHFGRSHDEKIAGSLGRFQDRRWLDVSFPLTPALSPGERENRSPSRAQRGARGNGLSRSACYPLLGERVRVRGNGALYGARARDLQTDEIRQ